MNIIALGGDTHLLGAAPGDGAHVAVWRFLARHQFGFGAIELFGARSFMLNAFELIETLSERRLNFFHRIEFCLHIKHSRILGNIDLASDIGDERASVKKPLMESREFPHSQNACQKIKRRQIRMIDLGNSKRKTKLMLVSKMENRYLMATLDLRVLITRPT